ncbi:hypothetical protein V8C86DRAFT_3133305 [Haematococcus lacustris]
MYKRSVSLPKARPRRRSATPQRSKDSAPKPAWDDTSGDLSKYKLTPEQLARRRQQRVSKNLISLEASLLSAGEGGAVSSGDEDDTKPAADAPSPHRSLAGKLPGTSPMPSPAPVSSPPINYSAVLQLLKLPQGSLQAHHLTAKPSPSASPGPRDTLLSPQHQPISKPQQAPFPAARWSPAEQPEAAQDSSSHWHQGPAEGQQGPAGVGADTYTSGEEDDSSRPWRWPCELNVLDGGQALGTAQPGHPSPSTDTPVGPQPSTSAAPLHKDVKGMRGAAPQLLPSDPANQVTHDHCVTSTSLHQARNHAAMGSSPAAGLPCWQQEQQGEQGSGSRQAGVATTRPPGLPGLHVSAINSQQQQGLLEQRVAQLEVQLAGALKGLQHQQAGAGPGGDEAVLELQSLRAELSGLSAAQAQLRADFTDLRRHLTSLMTSLQAQLQQLPRSITHGQDSNPAHGAGPGAGGGTAPWAVRDAGAAASSRQQPGALFSSSGEGGHSGWVTTTRPSTAHASARTNPGGPGHVALSQPPAESWGSRDSGGRSTVQLGSGEMLLQPSKGMFSDLLASSQPPQQQHYQPQHYHQQQQREQQQQQSGMLDASYGSASHNAGAQHMPGGAVVAATASPSLSASGARFQDEQLALPSYANMRRSAAAASGRLPASIYMQPKPGGHDHAAKAATWQGREGPATQAWPEPPAAPSASKAAAASPAADHPWSPVPDARSSWEPPTWASSHAAAAGAPVEFGVPHDPAARHSPSTHPSLGWDMRVGVSSSVSTSMQRTMPAQFQPRSLATSATSNLLAQGLAGAVAAAGGDLAALGISAHSQGVGGQTSVYPGAAAMARAAVLPAAAAARFAANGVSTGAAFQGQGTSFGTLPSAMTFAMPSDFKIVRVGAAAPTAGSAVGSMSLAAHTAAAQRQRSARAQQ